MVKKNQKKKNPSEDPNSGNEYYTIEKILAKKIEKNKTFYLIKWLNYGHEYNTWEPYENLILAIDLIANFEKKNSLGEEETQIQTLPQKNAPDNLIEIISENSEETKNNLLKKKRKDVITIQDLSFNKTVNVDCLTSNKDELLKSPISSKEKTMCSSINNDKILEKVGKGEIKNFIHKESLGQINLKKGKRNGSNSNYNLSDLDKLLEASNRRTSKKSLSNKPSEGKIMDLISSEIKDEKVTNHTQAKKLKIKVVDQTGNETIISKKEQTNKDLENECVGKIMKKDIIYPSKNKRKGRKGKDNKISNFKNAKEDPLIINEDIKTFPNNNLNLNESEENEDSGSILKGDKPFKILDGKINKEGKIILEIQWEKRKNGFTPKPSIALCSSIKKEFPYMLIDFYETKIMRKIHNREN